MALTPAEVQLLLSRVTRLEDEALLRLAMATGMRREDAVAVKLQDVDLPAGLVRFWEAKKQRPWKAWVGGETARVLAVHIDKLPRGTPWLFPSPWDPKHHLSSRQAYNILQKWLGGLRSGGAHDWYGDGLPDARLVCSGFS